MEERVKASVERIDNKLRREFVDKDWRGFEEVVAMLQTLPPGKIKRQSTA